MKIKRKKEKKSQGLEPWDILLKKWEFWFSNHYQAWPGGIYSALHSESPLSSEKEEQLQEGWAIHQRLYLNNN